MKRYILNMKMEFTSAGKPAIDRILDSSEPPVAFTEFLRHVFLRSEGSTTKIINWNIEPIQESGE